MSEFEILGPESRQHARSWAILVFLIAFIAIGDTRSRRNWVFLFILLASVFRHWPMVRVVCVKSEFRRENNAS